MSKRAVVLAGGRGTRLRPYTVVLPKPLMPVGEYPILEVIVRQLAAAEFDHITLAVNHQAELIQAFFNDGAKWGVHIDYSLEVQPLSTIGPLKLIRDLPDNFLLMNGDVLTDLPFAAFFKSHVRSGSAFSIAASLREHVIEYGVLDTDSDQLTGFREKPRMEYLVSMGIYGVNRRILHQYVPDQMRYGFDDLMTDMLERDDPVRVDRYQGRWLDIGKPDDYMEAIDIFEREQANLLPKGIAKSAAGD
jgi:NDP-mannose synthase